MSHSILIVEDDMALSEAYQTLLSHVGYEVRVAFNGKQALEVLENWQPELIFLDLRMPIMDGLAFLRVYDPATHPGTQVIVFSNYDMQKEVDAAYRLGADRYVLKAWASPREVLRIVEDAFKLQRKVNL